MRQTPDELRQLVQGYVDDVLAGARVVGKWERKAVERHVRDLEAVASGERTDLRFNETRALHPIKFAVRYVRHTKGEWRRQPFRFNRQSAWMAFILWSLFGWQRVDPESGKWVRRFRVAFVSIGRKNGKTMLAAIIAAYMLLALNEGGAEVYFYATKKDQAAIGWKQLAAILKHTPARDLKRRVRVTESRKTITVPDTESECVAVGRDYDTFDGKSPFLAVGDELHAQKSREGWDVMDSGMGARAEPLHLGITTAGAKKTGLCWQLDHDSQRLLDGVIEDDSHFAFIARLDDGDDPLDEATWPKANPNLGVSAKLKDIRDHRQRAINNPDTRPEFKRKRANLWSEPDLAWMPIERWDACAITEAPAEIRELLERDGRIDLDRLKGHPVFSGVDISATKDFTACVDVWSLTEHDLYVVVPRLWIPAETIQDRVKSDRVPVDVWIEQGWVHTTAGEIVDQDAVKQHLVELRKGHDVREVPIDPHQAWKLSSELVDLEFEAFHHRQGFLSMGPVVKESEQLILRGARGESPRIVHDGNPAMRWMVANVAAVKDGADNKKFHKDKSVDRIDGPVAMVMAVGRAVLTRDDGDADVYVIGGSA